MGPGDVNLHGPRLSRDVAGLLKPDAMGKNRSGAKTPCALRLTQSIVSEPLWDCGFPFSDYTDITDGILAGNTETAARIDKARHAYWSSSARERGEASTAFGEHEKMIGRRFGRAAADEQNEFKRKGPQQVLGLMRRPPRRLSLKWHETRTAPIPRSLAEGGTEGVPIANTNPLLAMKLFDCECSSVCNSA